MSRALAPQPLAHLFIAVSFAMTSSLVSAIFMLVSAMLAFWAYSYVKSQAEVFAAESASFDGALANAKMVSLGTAVHLSTLKRSSLTIPQAWDYSFWPLPLVVESSMLPPAGQL